MKKLLFFFALLLLAKPDAQAQDNFIGEIRIFSGNFAPQGWAFCDGRILQISENTALFSLIGNTYGGDGVSTFALPDMRSRLAIGTGVPDSRTQITPVTLGEKVGTETISTSQVRITPASTGSASNVLTLNPSNSQPSVTCNFIIALDGNYPARD